MLMRNSYIGELIKKIRGKKIMIIICPDKTLLPEAFLISVSTLRLYNIIAGRGILYMQESNY